MSEEAPSASWHPAMMPNAGSTALPPAQELEAATLPDDEPEERSSPLMQPEAESHGAPLDHDDGTGVDAWAAEFEEHDDDVADAWLADNGPADEPPTEPLPASQEETEAPIETTEATQEPAQEDTPEPAQPAVTSSSGAQHSSSMSFTRTVAHDLTFNDDDEGEWTLPRSDTDPFKFMPPTDRTNSFPPVPPQAAEDDAQPEPVLPTNQASDFLAKEDKSDDDDVAEEPTSHQGFHSHSRSVGGDVPLYEAQASDERYEEGLPLISPPAADEASSRVEDAQAEPKSMFDDEAGGDDFFGSIAQSTEGDEALVDIPPALERKSTMQVLGSALGSNDLSRQSTLQETSEAEEEEEEQQHPLAAVEEETHEPPSLAAEDTGAAPVEDVAAKWQEAFAADEDDDDFLLDDNAGDQEQFDPSAFLGSDDEGFLEDDDEEAAPSQTQPSASVAPNPYTPQAAPAQRNMSYAPSSSTTPNPAASTAFYQPPAPATSFGTVPQPTPPQTNVPRMQSFADKSKGGYASPYDLPTDLVNTVVKPRKRPSMQQIAQTSPGQPQAAPPPPTARSTSMFAPGPPSSTLSPPSSSHGPPLNSKTSAPVLRNKSSSSSFFEELPMAPKPRATSRQREAVAPGPTPGPPTPQSINQSPQMAHGQMAPPPPSTSYAPPQAQPQQPQQPPQPTRSQSDMAGLVAPDRVNPYATLQSAAPIVPAMPANTRYSPAPPQPATSSVPPAAASRYSPAPTMPRSSSSYSAGPVNPAASPMLAHQPRTSSPLAQFEINRTKSHGDAPNGEVGHPERRASGSSYEARLHRVASLPPTREVDEEEEQPVGARTASASHPSPPSSRLRYSPAPAAMAANQLSPPPATPQNLQSLSPQSQVTSPPAHQAPQNFAPPPRAQTQSPSKLYGPAQTTASNARPASAHSHTAPQISKAPQAAYAPTSRARGMSLEQNLMPPNDSRAQDPLQRWKGAALLTWGVGGTVVTCFPKSIPRYGLNQTTPSIIRSHGEVNVRTIKDIDPLQDRLAKFPGPLRGKSKKKETLAWLSAGIEAIEKELPDVSFHSQLSLEAKRAVERLLLWKILRVFIEFDGALEGTPAVEKAVRDILAPEAAAANAEGGALLGDALRKDSHNGMTSMSADGVDASAMEQIRTSLLKGDRASAVWAAVDKRLWGHAMLLSQTVSPDLYKQVAQEFVRKEVNYPGHQNESLAALYKILSGNHEDCVDELVPSHARAGLQLVSTASANMATGATADGLDKWHETLTLVLGNRSPEDSRGLKALGNLLASYGRAEAAHICYLFSRTSAVFGGLDDPTADFVLLGSDHRQQADQFAKETEALELSEVYEYGLTLSGSPAAAAGTPHLAAYKLQHAITLAEYGFRDKALQYCEAIAAAMTAQTRRSPYHHAVLEGAVDDFMRRLKQAPKGETGSWMSKPSMNKLSGSLLSKFNTFVSGDEGEGLGQGGENETGHFARIATTPNISRSPSVSNFEMYGTSPAAGASLLSPAASKYAPAAVSNFSSSPYEPSPYAPAAASSERGSGEYARGNYAPSYPGADTSNQGSSYMPAGHATSTGGYQPAAATPSYGGYQPQQSQAAAPAQEQPYSNGAPLQAAESQGYEPPASQGYEPQSSQGYEAPGLQGYEPPSYGFPAPETNGADLDIKDSQSPEGGVSSYEPPSYEYAPPSYEPMAAGDDDEEPKPKKKSFMDDDEDDIPALRPAATSQKSKSDVDRENEEMFRKAAEEDAKRAAAQQAQKKGWGFGGWFGKKADSPPVGEASNPNKPVRAKLGEASSFVYDPELKRWINKKPGAENVEAKAATPPPPRAAPRSVSGTPPPPSSATGTPPPPMAGLGMPPPRSIPGSLKPAPSMESLGGGAPMARSISNNSAAGGPPGPPSRPPSRPTTSMSNASSIDDLLGAAGPRKAGQKKPRKSGRYVDVMAK